MDYFKNKKLTNTYNKRGFIVNVYEPKMSKKERDIRDKQIKYDVLNMVNNLTYPKK